MFPDSSAKVFVCATCSLKWLELYIAVTDCVPSVSLSTVHYGTDVEFPSLPVSKSTSHQTNPVSPPFHWLDSLSVLPSTKSANHTAEVGANTLPLQLCFGAPKAGFSYSDLSLSFYSTCFRVRFFYFRGQYWLLWLCVCVCERGRGRWRNKEASPGHYPLHIG